MGLTTKLELLDEIVRLPVKLLVVTVKVLLALLPLTTLPNANDDALIMMLGTTQVPVTLTVLLVAPPPLIAMVAECEPAAEGW